MYGISATRTFRVGESTSTAQVPTFYLDENVQGIMSEEHAVKVALAILTLGVSMADRDGVEFHITAVKL